MKIESFILSMRIGEPSVLMIGCEMYELLPPIRITTNPAIPIEDLLFGRYDRANVTITTEVYTNRYRVTITQRGTEIEAELFDLGLIEHLLDEREGEDA